MTLQSFGFVRSASSATGSTVSEELEILEEQDSEEAPVTKKRCYNTGWAKTRPWLEYDPGLKLMFCSWCRSYEKNRDRNQFAKGCSSVKLESIKKMSLLNSIKTQNQPIKHTLG